jgi:xylulokinase
MNPTNLNRGNAYRAAMEGATYALRNGLDALRAAGLDFDAIRLTGGGSNSAAWRQMAADVFELPVDVPEQAEGAAFGAALQSLWAYRRANGDRAADIAAIAGEHVQLDAQRSARPEPPTTAAYADQYQQFRRHLGAVSQLYASHVDAAV